MSLGKSPHASIMKAKANRVFMNVYAKFVETACPNPNAFACRKEFLSIVKDGSDLGKIQLMQNSYIVFPWSSEYDEARKVQNHLFNRYPLMIYYVAHEFQIQHAVLIARLFKIPICSRSGSHEYLGYSTCDSGILVDVSNLFDIQVDLNSMTAIVQSGNTMFNIQKVLGETYNVTANIPYSPQIGTGSFLGGGIGPMLRKHGLTLDTILEARIVLPNGAIVTASETNHPDLFWAIRGGGGNNFGVVVSYKIKVFPNTVSTAAIYIWPVEQLEPVYNTWQQYATTAPNDVSIMLQLVANQGVFFVGVVHYGPYNEFDSIVADFINNVPPPLVAQTIPTNAYGAWLTLADCSSPPTQNSLGKWSCDTVYTPLHYWSLIPGLPYNPVPANVTVAIKDLLYQTTDTVSRLTLSAFGGRLAEIPNNATAFGHRNAKMLYDFLITGPTFEEYEESRLIMEQEYIREFVPYLGDYSGTRTAYRNSAAQLPNFCVAYYGAANCEKLKLIKKQYDPKNIFFYGQSIPLN